MHRVLAVPALGLILATLVGCTADPSEAGGILVLKNVAAGDACTTTAAEDELGISHGSLDGLFASDYLFIAQMRSRITALAGQESQRTIITSGARVDITFPGSTLFDAMELADLRSGGFTHFRQLFSAPIEPNNGVTDAGFALVPSSLVQKIINKAAGPFQIQLLATFTVEGDMSGQHVESQEYSYPVTISTGTSVRVVSACAAVDDTSMLNLGYSCNPFQDGVVDCCTSGTDLICPARKI